MQFIRRTKRHFTTTSLADAPLLSGLTGAIVGRTGEVFYIEAHGADAIYSMAMDTEEAGLLVESLTRLLSRKT